MNSDVKVGDTTYKIVGRIALPRAIVFHKPQKPKGHTCVSVIKKKNCYVPAGRIGGIVACGGAVSPAPESTAQTFARVPGKDAPSLYASIVSIHFAKKRSEGELVIAVLACGPRIAVPTVPEGERENGSSYNFNRMSLSVSGNKAVAGFALQGIETRPETFRILAMDEALLFVVPFRTMNGLKIEKEAVSDKAQTQSVNLLYGEFVLGTYSSMDNRYTETTKRDVVPAGLQPIPVIQP
jgi:hypothetical protein